MEHMYSKSEYRDVRIDREIANIELGMESSGSAVINRCFSDSRSRKGAYRCINNGAVTVERFRKNLQNQLVSNILQIKGVNEVLVAQDTMVTVRESMRSRLAKGDREVMEVTHHHAGAFSHSALVMKTDGMPLGFSYLEIWNRPPTPPATSENGDRKYDSRYYMSDPASGRTVYKYHVPVEERDSESKRWLTAARETRALIDKGIHIIMVQDREGDMYPLLTIGLENFDFIVRSSKDRRVRTSDGRRIPLDEAVCAAAAADHYQITVSKGPRKKGRKAQVSLSYGEVEILRPHSPVYPQKSVTLRFVRVWENGNKSGGKDVQWILLTSLPVDNVGDAKKIVEYYRKRWFIEEYHRLLKKKGFGIEDIQVESDHAFAINLAIAIKAAYDVALLKGAFDTGDIEDPASIVFDSKQMAVVEKINDNNNRHHPIHPNPFPPHSIAWAAWSIACFGGWSGLLSQPKPGLITFKRGIDRVYAVFEFLDEI